MKYYAPPKQTHRKGEIAPHGTRTRYVQHKCRCDLCRDAIRAYERRARKLRESPNIQTDWEEGLVSASEAKRHLIWLADQQIGLRLASKVSGVGRSSLAEIKSGRRKRIFPATSDRILAVGLSAKSSGSSGMRVDATETWKLIEEILAAGFAKAMIARELGQKGPGLQIQRTTVQLRHARKVQELHDRLFQQNVRGSYFNGRAEILGKTMREVCRCHDELDVQRIRNREAKRKERERKRLGQTA